MLRGQLAPLKAWKLEGKAVVKLPAIHLLTLQSVESLTNSEGKIAKLGQSALVLKRGDQANIRKICFCTSVSSFWALSTSRIFSSRRFSRMVFSRPLRMMSLRSSLFQGFSMYW